jgi:mannose-1-phosphate guanylyltransferase/mannose-1-phosphate guanylyltransferase/mannose-6-phosphate isomerase
MILASFDWIDIGSWDDYASFLSENTAADSDKNTEVFTAGTLGNSFVDSDIPVALAGVDDLIVVIRSGKDGSPPVALITRKGKTQYVKDIVEKLRQNNKTEIL